MYKIIALNRLSEDLNNKSRLLEKEAMEYEKRIIDHENKINELRHIAKSNREKSLSLIKQSIIYHTQANTLYN